jgi:hypothetical protein
MIKIPPLLVVTLSLLFAPAAHADDGAVGVTTDIGVPDGFMAGVIVRPLSLVRMHAVAGHNSLSPGVRAGLRLDGADGSVAPFLAAELGYYFAGDAQPWARALAEDAGLDGAELQTVRYTFYNLHLGMRFGDDGKAFFIQGGASRVNTHLELHENRPPSEPMMPTVDVYSSADVGVWTPSGRIGMVAWF